MLDSIGALSLVFPVLSEGWALIFLRLRRPGREGEARRFEVRGCGLVPRGVGGGIVAFLLRGFDSKGGVRGEVLGI